MRRAAIIIFGLVVSVNAMGQGERRRGAAGASSHRAEAVSASMTTVDAVLDRYVKAIGGRQAIEKLTSRVAKGSLVLTSLAGLKGTVEIYQEAPDKQVAFLNLTGIGTAADGFDGAVAWALEPDAGVTHLKAGPELAQARREAQFYIDLKLKELYPRMTLKGVLKMGARRAYVVEAVPAEGDAERFYFDTQTALLVRHDSKEEGDGGKRNVEEYYSDFRVVDGVKLPFVIRQVSPGMDMTVTLTEVRHNIAIDRSKFQKPEEQ